MDRLRLEQNPETGEYRFKEMKAPMLPLCEGMCVPEVDEDGEPYYPEPVEYEDPEIREEEKFFIKDKEELYDYMTVCKGCGTEFIAVLRDEHRGYYQTVRNYCPGCGERLVSE